jgi:hypothetical protein
MDQDNRVLARKGARTLSAEEIERVGGGLRLPTDTVCTFGPNGKDGDTFLGEC